MTKLFVASGALSWWLSSLWAKGDTHRWNQMFQNNGPIYLADLYWKINLESFPMCMITLLLVGPVKSFKLHYESLHLRDSSCTQGHQAVSSVLQSIAVFAHLLIPKAVLEFFNHKELHSSLTIKEMPNFRITSCCWNLHLKSLL